MDNTRQNLIAKIYFCRNYTKKQINNPNLLFFKKNSVDSSICWWRMDKTTGKRTRGLPSGGLPCVLFPVLRCLHREGRLRGACHGCCTMSETRAVTSVTFTWPSALMSPVAVVPPVTFTLIFTLGLTVGTPLLVGESTASATVAV